MGQAVLEQIQRLPQSLQQEALQYIEGLVPKHNLHEQTPAIIQSQEYFWDLEGTGVDG